MGACVYFCNRWLMFIKAHGFLLGEFECKLDTKGRLALPSKVRSSLPDVSTNELILQKDFEPNLILYTKVEFSKYYESKISELNRFNDDQRKFRRTFSQGIAHVELDTANRILLPKKMLEHASIDKEVLLVCTGNEIELWNPSLFEEYSITDRDEFSNKSKEFLDK